MYSAYVLLTFIRGFLPREIRVLKGNKSRSRTTTTTVPTLRRQIFIHNRVRNPCFGTFTALDWVGDLNLRLKRHGRLSSTHNIEIQHISVQSFSLSSWLLILSLICNFSHSTKCPMRTENLINYQPTHRSPGEREETEST